MGVKLGSTRRGRNRGRTERFAEINITPMVDVMLVLLIIFMVAAPMMTSGVTVDLPESKASPIKGQDEPLTVSVTKDGDVYVQKTKLPVNALQEKLKAITGEKRDTRIFVRGDQGINYGTIMQVVGEINAAGFRKVALITMTAADTTQKKKK